MDGRGDGRANHWAKQKLYKLDIPVTVGKNWFDNLKMNLNANQSFIWHFPPTLESIVLDNIKYFEQSNVILKLY